MKQIVKGLMLVISCSLYLNVASQSINEVVSINSKIYKQQNKIVVYTAHGKLPATAALPVFYLANLNEKDSLFYSNLNKMVEDGSMPPMMIVGIYKQMSDKGMITEITSYDPKNSFADFKSDDDTYFDFINNEVVPAIEKKYNCSKYKILSSQETAFTNYILKNHPASFSAYVFEKPFIWIDNTAKNGSALSVNNSVDIYFPGEFYLKYGKKPAWHQE